MLVWAPVVDWTWVVVDVVATLSFWMAWVPLATATTGNSMLMDQFLWLSDLHLDPFYGTDRAVGVPGSHCFDDSIPSHGQLGCDSPLRLVEETIRQASQWNVSFVIVTGDLCRHGTDQLDDPLAMTQGILANVSQLLRHYLPDVSIIPSIGNNDVTPDYYLDINDPMEVLSMVAQGLDVLMESDEERAFFMRGGFFARNVSDSLTILSLNTLIYSTSHIPHKQWYHGQVNDPLAQFAWLASQLVSAAMANRHVYIVGHIPPSMGSYRHSQLWQEPYLHTYYSILQNHSSVIRGQFFGHLHADEFRWIESPNIGSGSGDEDEDEGEDEDGDHVPPSSWPLWIASSITPVYGSNPSYRLVSFDASTGALLDYDTLYLNLLSEESTLEWKQGPSFRDSFSVPDLSPYHVGSLVQTLNDSITDSESTLWQNLVNRQHVYIHESALPCQEVSCRRAWICTILTITAKEYSTCLGNGGANIIQVAWARLSLQERILVCTLLILFGLVTTIWCLCRFGSTYFRRRHYQEHVSMHDDDHDDGVDGGTSRKNTTTSKKMVLTLPTAPSSSMEASYHRNGQDNDVPELSTIPSIT